MDLSEVHLILLTEEKSIQTVSISSNISYVIYHIIILQINFLQSDWLRCGIYETVYTVSKLPIKVPRHYQ